MNKLLINSIKRDFPEDALYFSDLLSQINDEVALIIDRYSSNEDKILFVEELNEIESKINNIILELDISYGQISMGNLVDENISSEEKINPNYKNYKVDSTIEHSLLEDLTHIRPYGFKFVNGEVVGARTWKDVFVRTCEILLKIDEKKFMSFENATRMNGETRDYFSKDSSNIILPVKILDKIFVTTSMSANGFSELIVLMLKEYDYNVDEYKLYFYADYTPLHRK